MRKIRILLVSALVLFPCAFLAGESIPLEHYVGLAGKISYSNGFVLGVEPFYFLGDPIVGSLKAGCAAAYNFTARHFSLVPSVSLGILFFSIGLDIPINFTEEPTVYITPKAGLTLMNQFMLDFGYHFRAPEDVRKFNVSLAVSPYLYHW
jgi:hypothetical protein